MNKVILMGRLTADPQVNRNNNNGKETVVTKYSLAVSRRFAKEGEVDVDFFNCTAFGKSAEFAEKYFTKGQQVLIEGRIQTNNYTNKQGEKVYGVQVIIDNQYFADSKRENAGGGNNNTSAPSSAGDGFMNIPDGFEDELPFN